VFAAALFDVFDGMAARALGGGSPLGAQLDSLADMVSFGVAPAFALFTAATLRSGDLAGRMADPTVAVVPEQVQGTSWPLFAGVFMLVIASCWRLARFNLDTRQTSGFLGLPTPANGLFWASLVLAANAVATRTGPGHRTLEELVGSLFAAPHVLLILTVIMAALMLSELPLPSLKFKHFRWQGNQVIYLLGGIGVVLVVLYGILAVPLIMGLYILSPLWGRVFQQGN
jgi:CDP-diacylglycerol--serine O-phosphatidyltransferase